MTVSDYQLEVITDKPRFRSLALDAIELGVFGETDLVGNDEDPTYFNDEQDGVNCEVDVFDLLSEEELRARRNPDQYIRIIDKYSEDKVWKAVAKFQRWPSTPVGMKDRVDTKVVYSVRWDEAAEQWDLTFEIGDNIHPFGHVQNYDDAVAYAVEMIRCLAPTALLSDAELANQPSTLTRESVAQIVASFYINEIRVMETPWEAMPCRVQAIALLTILHSAGAQFEMNKEGIWQLWQEDGDDLMPETISKALAVEHDIAALLDTTWDTFVSWKNEAYWLVDAMHLPRREAGQSGYSTVSVLFWILSNSKLPI